MASVTRTGKVSIGIDIGQKRDPTAICVTEAMERWTPPLEDWQWDTDTIRRNGGLATGADLKQTPAKTERIYETRYLERQPLGTPYPQVADRVAEIVDNVTTRPAVNTVYIWIDVTGVGLPVYEMIRDRIKYTKQGGRRYRVWLVPVMFTHGHQFRMNGGQCSLGKAYLVSLLQSLLQTDSIRLPQTAESAALKAELENYEIKVNQDADMQAGAFRTGTHDDLATALGLACLYEANERQPLTHHNYVRRR